MIEILKPNVKIKFVRLTLDKNQVGNEWTYEALVDGNKIKEGEEISTNQQNIQIKVAIWEDDKVVDEAEETVNIRNIKNNDTISISVSVPEEGGRKNKDSIAKAEFEFSIKTD